VPFDCPGASFDALLRNDGTSMAGLHVKKSLGSIATSVISTGL